MKPMKQIIALFALTAAAFIQGCATTSAPAPALATDVPVEQTLTDIRGYEFGQSREALTVVEDIVRAAAQGPDAGAGIAADLTDVALDAGSTPDCRQFVLQQLVFVGTPDEAKRLLPLLIEPSTSDDARYALHAIPGKKVDAVLIEALDTASDALVKEGLINTLGERGAENARDALEAYAAGPNPELAAAANAALAKLP